MAETAHTFADPFWNGDDEMGDDFDQWIRELDEDVVQGEFGYERGEYDVFPALWWPLYHEKLTPRQAWQRAMDAPREPRP